VNGTRGDQNNFILDGIDNNSNDNGDVSVLSSVDAIAEFKVETSNYSPEFGRGGGAVINASTKSGTNNFHGELWEFLRNQAFDASQYGFGSNIPKAPYKQNQFGGTLGVIRHASMLSDGLYLLMKYSILRPRGRWAALSCATALDSMLSPVFQYLDKRT
jgi:hypothetical protein